MAVRHDIVTEVYRDLSALEAHWRELEARSTTHSAAQSFDYAALAWAATAKGPQDRLAVVTVRRGGRLAAVWPLYVSAGGRKSVARHLGNGAEEEYADLLVADDEDAGDLAKAALRAAKGVADLLVAHNLRADGPMAAASAADRGFKHRWTVWSPVISLSRFADWTAWAATRSKSFRYNLRNERKLLGAEGVVRSVRMQGPADGARFADWMFAHKRAWLDVRGIGDNWLRGAQGRDLFAALLARPASEPPRPGDAIALAITVDDAIVAGGFSLLSHDRLEFFVTVFDAAYARYRPGNLLNEDHARWAVAHGVDLDFRTMLADYKDRWADRRDRYESFYLACSWRGAVAVLAQSVRVKLRALKG